MKIRADIVKMYIDVHSWVGVVSGLALFIAFYAGAITMFEEPLKRWASPPVALSEITPLDRTPELIAKVVAGHPEAAKRHTIVMQPGPESLGRLTWTEGDDDHHPGQTLHANLAADGSLLVSAEGPSPVAQLVDTLHQQVGLPLDHEIAMPIMGAISLLYAVALVSGVIILLPSLVKDLFALRIGKNVKRMWLDVHNVLGLFSLPFHVIMALTAVVFAFHDQFYDAQVRALSDPAPAETKERSDGREPSPIGPLLTPAAVASALAGQAPNFTPLRLSYSSRGPDGPLGLRVEGVDPRHGLRGPTFGVAMVDPYTGQIVSDDYMPGRQKGWFKAVTSFFALHFGNFGGNTVRWAYFALGIAGALLFYTGNLLWIESHRRKKRKGEPLEESRSVEVMARLTVGVSLGCVIGISLTVAAAKWGLPARGLEAWHTAIYYAAFLAAIGWAFLRGAPRASVELLWAAVAASLLVPLSSLASLAGASWSHAGSGRLVDVTAALGAAVFAWIAFRAGRRMANAPSGAIWRIPAKA